MFKKILLLLPLAALLNGTARAQFRYTFKDTTTAYTPLPAGATSVNGTDIWDEEDYSIPMPFSWKLDSTIQLNNFNLSLGFSGVLDDPSGNNPISGFITGVADIVDRGALNGIMSESPIRYITTGTTPNRIFKVEVANAGFYQEIAQHNTANDSVSFQMWIYETSNTVEFHYGPSKITYFNDYFDLGIGSASVIAGMAQQFDPSGSGGTIYYLTGPASAVSVTSVTLPNIPTNGLSAWPANGKVYRFTPKVTATPPPPPPPSGIQKPSALGTVKVYPNPATTSLHIEGVSAGTKATLYSALGQTVLETVLAGEQSLNIANLPAGMYKLVLIDREGDSSATTVVKE